MFPRPQSTTPDLTLEAFCARLQAHPETAAIVLAGSAATGLNAASDVDVAVIVDRHPCPARTGTTWADGRLIDLGFASKNDVVEALAGRAPDRPDPWLTLASRGRVVYDRDGIFKQTPATQPEYRSPAADLFQRWDHTSYNLAQSARYAAAADPLYHDALRLRLTYQLADVMLDYFALRHLPWEGEKAAVRYWQAHDPHFLREFFACLDTTDIAEKQASYERLVHRALAPVGKPWTAPEVSMTPAVGFEQTEALRFWQELIGP